MDSNLLFKFESTAIAGFVLKIVHRYEHLLLPQMGINRINPLIKRYAPDAFFTMPISKLAGKRIVIDAHGWMYANMSTARKKVVDRTDIVKEEPNMVDIRREWFLSAIAFILKWLSYNVTPIFVFDGHHPSEKDATKEKRHAKRIAQRAKIDAIYSQLRNNPLDAPGNLIEELRKELRNYNSISAEDFELFKTVLAGIGIPCLQAAADGEQVCAMLCVEGKVAAVFSVDTDNLVYGCPLVINKFSESSSYDENGNRVLDVKCVRLDRALAGLNIPHSVFVDLCIMSGCDYNKNMPGYAAIKSFGLLQKWGSIDDLPRNLNIECLRHLRCRDIFKYVPSASIIVEEDEETPPIDEEEVLPLEDVSPMHPAILRQPIIRGEALDINKMAIANARDYLEMVGVGGQIEKIIANYERLTPSTAGTVADLQLLPGPRYVPPPPRVTLQIIPPAPIRFLTLNVSTAATSGV